MNEDAFHERGSAPREHGGAAGGAALDAFPAGAGPAEAAGARAFIAAQCMAAVGSIDAEGAVWVSLLFGKPGFLRTSDGGAIRIDMPPKERDLADPVWENMAVGADLGLLFVDYAARRRYRINGTVQRLDRRGTEVLAHEAGPGRPGYIPWRMLRELGEPRLPVQTAHGAQVRGAVERIVRCADTLFVACRQAAHGAAVTHRGGDPGFVTVAGPTTLRLPDDPGNGLCGNDRLEGRAGICIPDFDNGQVLQLTGHVRSGGAGRHWDFEVSHWVLRDMPRAVTLER